MAKKISEENSLLIKRARRRLVGSVTLVVLAIVILPILFDKQPVLIDPGTDIHISLKNSLDESPPGPGVVSAEQKLTSSSLETGSLVKEMAQGESQLPIESAQVIAELESKLINSAPEIRAEVKDNSETEKTATGLFIVQLGVFLDSAKAKYQQKILISKNIKMVYTETLKTDDGEVTRLRIGPFLTRIMAEEERGKLKKLGIESVVKSQ
ncbi:MAG: SPOR domain-containing protein [Nitrosospira sp.]|nr:SPOR domain-containing protein [Nitrosospira sp.]